MILIIEIFNRITLIPIFLIRPRSIYLKRLESKIIITNFILKLNKKKDESKMNKKILYAIFFTSLFLLSTASMVQPVRGYETGIPAEAKGHKLKVKLKYLMRTNGRTT